MAKGGLSLSLFVSYFRSGGSLLSCIIVLLLLFGGVAIYLSCTWYLSSWGTMDDDKQDDTEVWVGFLLLALATYAVSTLRAVAFTQLLTSSAKKLHSNMLDHVIRSPMSFFDSNPSGRIVNRFSKDISFIDELIPLLFFDVCNLASLLAGILISVAIVSPWSLFFLAFFVVLTVKIRGFYMNGSRQVKRLEAVSRSPVFSLLGECMNGLPSIRSFGLQQALTEKFQRHVEGNTQMFYAFIVTARWLAVCLDTTALILLAAASLGSVALRASLDAGNVGLALSLLMQLTGMVQWFIRQVRCNRRRGGCFCGCADSAG